jgi:hypothetical protein
MKLLKRQKISILGLILYIPGIFILTHIPIPLIVRQANVSDKFLHFLAYMILVFLMWYSVSREEKVRWSGWRAWLVLLIAMAYGGLDEIIQGYVGRSCDFWDFLADVEGAGAGLILFTFLNLSASMLAVTGIGIFLLTNLAQKNPAELMPVTNVLFHVIGYATFTLLWIWQMQNMKKARFSQIKWLIAILVPAAFLLMVKISAVIYKRAFSRADMIYSFIGIGIAVLVIFTAGLIWGRLKINERT